MVSCDIPDVTVVVNGCLLLSVTGPLNGYAVSAAKLCVLQIAPEQQRKGLNMIKEEEEDGNAPQAEEQQLRRRYEELCSTLNMDERARAEAWDSYARISQNYTLEVRGLKIRSANNGTPRTALAADDGGE